MASHQRKHTIKKRKHNPQKISCHLDRDRFEKENSLPISNFQWILLVFRRVTRLKIIQMQNLNISSRKKKKLFRSSLLLLKLAVWPAEFCGKSWDFKMNPFIRKRYRPYVASTTSKQASFLAAGGEIGVLIFRCWEKKNRPALKTNGGGFFLEDLEKGVD